MFAKLLLPTLALVALLPSATAIELEAAGLEIRALEPHEAVGVHGDDLHVSVYGAASESSGVIGVHASAADAVRIDAAAAASAEGAMLYAGADAADQHALDLGAAASESGAYAAGQAAGLPVGPVAVPPEPETIMERIQDWLRDLFR